MHLFHVAFLSVLYLPSFGSVYLHAWAQPYALQGRMMSLMLFEARSLASSSFHSSQIESALVSSMFTEYPVGTRYRARGLE